MLVGLCSVLSCVSFEENHCINIWKFKTYVYFIFDSHTALCMDNAVFLVHHETPILRYIILCTNQIINTITNTVPSIPIKRFELIVNSPFPIKYYSKQAIIFFRSVNLKLLAWSATGCSHISKNTHNLCYFTMNEILTFTRYLTILFPSRIAWKSCT